MVVEDYQESEDELMHDESYASDEEESQVSSVPTTVPSVMDERTAASILAQKESQRVLFSKLMLIGVFVVVSIFVSVAVYGFAKSEEQGDVKEEVSINQSHSLKRRKRMHN
jgi:hypothetical protein